MMMTVYFQNRQLFQSIEKMWLHMSHPPQDYRETHPTLEHIVTWVFAQFAPISYGSVGQDTDIYFQRFDAG
jgi:hypothetical protein